MTGPPAAGSGRPPELLFCRRCGGSVARREILTGRARLLEDRAFCPACAPGALALRRSLRWAAGGAAGALLLLALAAALDARRRSVEAEAAARDARAEAAALAGRARGDGDRVASLEAGVRGLAEAAARLASGLQALREEAARGREEQEDRLEGVERSLATVLDTLEGVRREVTALQGNPPLTEEEERAALERLREPNAGARFEALWILQRGSGAAARQAAVLGLDDPEDGVRYQAAILARELGVREAVPALVRCLSCPGAAVRSAALEALVALEGTDLGFDPLDPSEESRSEAIHRWEERIRPR